MSEGDRGRLGGADDRLPWLEPVEEDRAAGPGAAKLVAALLVALVIIGLVVGGIFWLSAGRPGTGSGELIAAPEGDYKVKPDQPGGMKVEGEGETAFAASDGHETDAAIDLSAIPETPVAGAGSVTSADAATGSNDQGALPAGAARPVPVPPAPAPSRAAAVTPPAAPVPAAPKAAKPSLPAPAEPATGGAQIQLGAFGSEAKANAAWKTLSTRFTFLAPLTKSVTPVVSGDKTLYRLRASGGQARALCARLTVAGETCAVIG